MNSWGGDHDMIMIYTRNVTLLILRILEEIECEVTSARKRNNIHELHIEIEI